MNLEALMEDPGRAITTTIRLRPSVWLALRRLAEAKALQAGRPGRPSASATLSALVEAEVARREGCDGRAS